MPSGNSLPTLDELNAQLESQRGAEAQQPSQATDQYVPTQRMQETLRRMAQQPDPAIYQYEPSKEQRDSSPWSFPAVTALTAGVAGVYYFTHRVEAVKASEARIRPTDSGQLRGVGGWLVFLVINLMVLSPIYTIGGVWVELSLSEHQIPGLQADTYWQALKDSLMLGCFIVSALFFFSGLALWKRHEPISVGLAKFTLCANPFVWLFFGLANGMLGDIFGAVLASAIASAIWIAYLSMSVRVSNTYGLSRSGNSGSLPTVPPSSPSVPEPTPTKGSALTACTMDEDDVETTIARMRNARESARKNSATDDAIYNSIAQEFADGNLDQGLWIRLFSECDGDETQTKVRYIKERANRLRMSEQIA